MKSQAPRIQAWLTQAALPLWATAGFDAAHSSFVERLSMSGTPDFAATKRVRVQARQIYVYSHAAILGLWPGGTELAMRAFEFLREKAWLKDGGVAHLLDRSGAVIDGRRDTYDHAFVLYALSWLYRASGDKAVAAAIESVRGALDRHLRHPVSGYLEDDQGGAPRRQNPHMHLFEASLAAYAATNDAQYLEHANTLGALFRNHFFDSKAGALREFFNDNWSPLPGEAGRTIEPGHHFEWVWLLHRWSAAGRGAVPDEARGLFEFANRHGIERSSGLAYDEVWIEGGVKKATKRSWPQTEALKAELAVSQGVSARADAIVDGLFHYYLDRGAAGGWNDVVDSDNAPLSTNMPASTFYHVFLAFTEYLAAAAPAAPA